MRYHARRLAAALAVALLLAALPARSAHAWGDRVHKAIVRLAVDILPEEVRRRLGLPGREMAAASVEPDERAKRDRAEGPRQYIDIEMTAPEFLAAWRRKLAGAGEVDGESMAKLRSEFVREYFSARKPPLPQAESDKLFRALPGTLDGFLGKVGLDGGGWIGTGPYTVGVRYGELVAALRAGRLAEARALAGELSHYVADLHMPLHGTINYKGQFTGNLIFSTKDPYDPSRHCHVRYEVIFCRDNISRLTRAVSARLVPARLPEDGRTPVTLAIDAARRAYPLGAKVLQADRQVLGMAPADGSAAAAPRSLRRYSREMYSLTGEITARQLALSVQMTADLIFAAYHEAGPIADPAAAARKAAAEAKAARLAARAERAAESRRAAEEERTAELAARAERAAAQKKLADEKTKADDAARKAADAKNAAGLAEREAAEKKLADEKAKADEAARKAADEKNAAGLAEREAAEKKLADEKAKAVEKALKAAEEKRKRELAQRRAAETAAAETKAKAAERKTLFDQAVTMSKQTPDRETRILVLETVAAELGGTPYERRLVAMIASERRFIAREAARKAAAEKKAAAAEKRAAERAERAERAAAQKKLADEKAKADDAARKAANAKNPAGLAEREAAEKKLADEKATADEAARKAADAKNAAGLAEREAAAKKLADEKATAVEQALKAAEEERKRELAQRRAAETAAAEAKAKAADRRRLFDQAVTMAKQTPDRETSILVLETARDHLKGTPYERKLAALAASQRRLVAREAARKAAAEKKTAAAEKRAAERAERAEREAAAKKLADEKARAAAAARETAARNAAEAKALAAAKRAAERAARDAAATTRSLPAEAEPAEAAPARALKVLTAAMKRGGVGRVSGLCTKKGLVGLMKRESRAPGTIAGEGSFLEGVDYTWRLEAGKARATYAPSPELRYHAAFVKTPRGWKLDSCGWSENE